MWIASYDYYMKSLDEIIKWLFDNVYFLTINNIDVIMCPLFLKKWPIISIQRLQVIFGWEGISNGRVLNRFREYDNNVQYFFFKLIIVLQV